MVIGLGGMGTVFPHPTRISFPHKLSPKKKKKKKKKIQHKFEFGLKKGRRQEEKRKEKKRKEKKTIKLFMCLFSTPSAHVSNKATISCS